jgi:serine/threonine-protein kinase
MSENTEQIIKSLQNISTAIDADVKEVLIAKFKHDFPDNLDWLDMFAEDKLKEFEKYKTQLPEIDGYEILKSIGSGASGKVFLARDLKSDKHVAIKVPMVFLTPEQMHRFAHESRLLSRLTHSNIAHIEKTGMIEKDNLPYIVMEFVDGKTIHQYCKDKQLDFKTIIKLFKQVLDAVQYAHNKGIVHRDIKPDNILVNKKGEVKLLDFGIALATDNSTQQLTQLTKTGEIVGTLAYMSPEQVSGNDDLDTRADVYSLGVVLYQLLSDSLPYQIDAGKIFSAISQIIEDLPKKLTTQNHKIDATLATIVHHAIEKSPDARYQSPRDFKKDLDNWIKGEGISVKKQSLWHSLKHLANQHKAIVTGASLAVLGLVLGLVFAVSFAFKEQEARKIAEISAETNKRTVSFIKDIFESADPENIYGDQLTVLQAIDTAEASVERELNGLVEVEIDIRSTLANVYASLQQFEKSQKQLEHIKQLIVKIDREPEQLKYKYGVITITAKNNILLSKAKENILPLSNIVEEIKDMPQEFYIARRMLANSYLVIGELEKAEKIIMLLLNVPASEAIPKTSKLRYPTKIIYANILKEKGDFEKAEEVYLEVMHTYEKLYGAEHYLTQTVLNNLSNIYQKTGDNDKAEDILLKVVLRRKKMLGEFNYNTFTARANLLAVQIRKGMLLESEEKSKQLLIDAKKHLGELNSVTLEISNTRAYLLEDLNHLEDAEKLYRETLKAFELSGTTKGASLVGLQNNLAMLLMKENKYDESNSVFEKVINNIEESLGKEHFYYGIIIGNYGGLLLKMGKYDKAKNFLNISYEKVSKTFGDNHARTLKIKEKLDELAALISNK